MFSYCKLLIIFIITGGLPLLKTSHVEKRILNGSIASPGKFPYQVALAYTNETYLQFCSGAIISERLVITAAHCMFRHERKLQPKDIYVIAGEVSLTSSTNRYNLEVITTHENFQVRTLDANLPNDIAIIKIVGRFPLNETQPIPIPNQGYIEGSVCTVAGWGIYSYDSSDLSSELFYTNLTISNDFDCIRRYRAIGLAIRTENVICVEGNNTDTCNGDSGSPLVCTGPDSINYLTGIVSWGIGCSSNLPAIYTDVFQYKSWIEINSSKTLSPIAPITYILLLPIYISTK